MSIVFMILIMQEIVEVETATRGGPEWKVTMSFDPEKVHL